MTDHDETTELRWDRGRDDSALERVTRELSDTTQALGRAEGRLEMVERNERRWREIAGTLVCRVVDANIQEAFLGGKAELAMRQAWAGKLDEVE